MDNNKNKILTLIAIITIILTLIGATYAYFAAQAGGTTSTNATVTSNTTDLLTFSINQDISFTVTQAGFASGAGNQYGEATATATLTPNNKTGAATMNYYLYLNLQSNPTVYSAANTNHDPELMLQVFDGSNQLITLTGLGTEKTIKGVTGYDITGITGFKTLLDNHAISASNNTATIENWRVVITLINLDVNQNDNTGKQVSGTIIIKRDEASLCEIDPGSCFTLNVSSPASLPGKSVTLTGTGINATWNNKYNQLEVSSIGNQNDLTITSEQPSGTTLLNTYLLSLDGTTQGDGEFVHEIDYIPDYTTTTVIKTFGTTPVYFRNTSNTSTTQTQVDSFWTFNSSTGVFTSDPSKFISGTSNYYHVYTQIPSAGYYQICYTMTQSINGNERLSILKSDGTVMSFNPSTVSDKPETCSDIGYYGTNDYINISELGYNGPDSSLITFRLEKSSEIPVDTWYRYEGENPNNYIMFNNELWRIIGVFPTEYDSNGDGSTNTTTNLVKIIREESLGNVVWDKAGHNDWPNATLYYLLNEQYYNWNENKNNIGLYCYGHTNIEYTPSVCDYSIDGIQDSYRSMIVKTKWYLGGSGKNGYDTKRPANIYTYERDPNAVNTGRSSSTTGYIGLIYVSDYLYGVLKSNCNRSILYSSYNSSTCAGKNWLYNLGMAWTISPGTYYLYDSFIINKDGSIGKNNVTAGGFIRPVLYLSPLVYKVNGSGTITDPYIIGM